jgi:hypothetical protein
VEEEGDGNRGEGKEGEGGDKGGYIAGFSPEEIVSGAPNTTSKEYLHSLPHSSNHIKGN